MESLNAALIVLQDIIANKTSFHSALKKCFDSIDKNKISSGDVSALCGCYLRHYIVFNTIFDKYFSNAKDNTKIAMGLCFANALFLKRLNNDDCLKFVTDVAKNDNYELNIDDFKNLLEKKINGEPLINPELNKISYEFISQRYNVNEWICKMWTNQFGKNKAIKIARANTKTAPIYLQVNTLLCDKKTLLESYKDEFIDTPKNDLLIYNKKDSIRRKQYIVTNKAVIISPIIKEILDKIDIDVLKPVYLYSGYANGNVFLNLSFRFLNNLHIDNFITPNKDLFTIAPIVNRYQLKNINTIECTPSGLITAISSKTPLFVVMPDSSNFYRLRNEPDYFLNFDKNSLDDLITKQKETIQECSKYVEDDGLLVYFVTTIDRKEGQLIVLDFLSKNKQFTLLDDRQCFPFEEEGDSIYYAILKKAKTN